MLQRFGKKKRKVQKAPTKKKASKIEVTRQRLLTFIGLLIGELHLFLCGLNYIMYVRQDEENLGPASRNAYFAFCAIGSIFFFGGASIFYMWGLRFYKPERLAARKRSFGLVINLLFSDIPFFVIEVDMAWKVNLKAFIQGLSFIVTCVSFAYSMISLWLFLTSQAAKQSERHKTGRVKGRQRGLGPLINQPTGAIDVDLLTPSPITMKPVDSAIPGQKVPRSGMSANSPMRNPSNPVIVNQLTYTKPAAQPSRMLLGRSGLAANNMMSSPNTRMNPLSEPNLYSSTPPRHDMSSLYASPPQSQPEFYSPQHTSAFLPSPINLNQSGGSGQHINFQSSHSAPPLPLPAEEERFAYGAAPIPPARSMAPPNI